MASLRRFTQGVVPFLLLGSCAELIGLSDYETGEASDDGGGGEGDTGGRGGTGQGGSAGTGAKPGVGGEDDGGQGGTVGGRPPIQGGTSGDGGVGGEPEGGDGGKGGTNATGGTAGGGTGGASGAGNGGGGTGGSGGSPVCTEILLPTYVGAVVDPTLAPAVAAFYFEIDPELGDPFTDTFEFQFWDGSGSYDGALTGSFMLGPPGPDSNYVSCSRCLIVRQDEDTSREKILFQTEGTVILAEGSTQMDGFPSWTFDDVTLREVTIDENQVSTVVPDGECVHITTMSYTREAPTNWACDIVWYSDGDCDCGCGQLDPTCTSASATACDYCWCNTASVCSPNEVVASQNWLCN